MREVGVGFESGSQATKTDTPGCQVGVYLFVGTVSTRKRLEGLGVST